MSIQTKQDAKYILERLAEIRMLVINEAIKANIKLNDKQLNAKLNAASAAIGDAHTHICLRLFGG